MKAYLTSALVVLLSSLALLTPTLHATSVQLYGDAEYQVFTESLTWERAEENCQLWGGSLASIGSAEENQFLLNILPAGSANVWFGLSNKESGNYWFWSDLYLEDGILSEANFTNWADGEPAPQNNYNCIQMLSVNGEWDNYDCNANFPYVCKRPSGSCGWGSAITGAPKPLVTTKIISSDSVQIDIEVAQKESKNVTYELSLSQFFSPSEEKCLLGQDQLLNGFNVTRKECSATLSGIFTFDELFNMQASQLKNEPGSNIVTMLKKLNIAYYDKEDGSCTASVFDTEISLRTVLNADSSLAFAFNDGQIMNPPQYSTLTINSEGKLVFFTRFTLVDEDLSLENIEFKSHSRGIQFEVSSSTEDCVDGAACVYELNVVSTEAQTDFSGSLDVEFDLVWANGARNHTSLTFLLKYDILEDEEALDYIIETETNLVSSDDFTQILNSFTPFERTFVLTSTVPEMDLPYIDFEYDSVYICCTKGMVPLTAYNPDLGQMGCTIRDDNTMSFWSQLIGEGELNADMSVEMENLGPLVKSKLAFSFDPIGLFGDDKLCYIQTISRITIGGDMNAEKRSTKEDSTVIRSNSMRAVTLQSCSVYGSSEECKANAYCAWNADVKGCYNSDSASSEDNDSSGAEKVTGSMIALVIALSAVMLAL